jgi:hypothetical protein
VNFTRGQQTGVEIELLALGVEHVRKIRQAAIVSLGGDCVASRAATKARSQR